MNNKTHLQSSWDFLYMYVYFCFRQEEPRPSAGESTSFSGNRDQGQERLGENLFFLIFLFSQPGEGGGVLPENLAGGLRHVC